MSKFNIIRTNVPGSAVPVLLACFEELRARPDSEESRAVARAAGADRDEPTYSLGYVVEPGAKRWTIPQLEGMRQQIAGAFYMFNTMTRKSPTGKLNLDIVCGKCGRGCALAGEPCAFCKETIY